LGEVLTGLRTAAALIVLSLCSNPLRAQVGKPLVQAEISRQADTAHLELKGLKTWRYDVQKTGDRKVTLNIPPIDAPSVARLQGFTDALVESVKVDKNGVDGSYSVHFTLTNAEVETFDYLTDEPSRLIVDFYRKAPEVKPLPAKAAEGSPASSAKKPSKVASAQKDRKPGEYQQVKEGSRRPAGDEFIEVAGAKDTTENVDQRFGVFDGGDENYDRFRIKDYEIREDAIISARHNIYLPFPMLKMKVSQLDTLMDQQPEYIINPKDDRENKEARLLLTLFNRKRNAVFIKTYDYFVNKYPNSEYLEILKNLYAHIHLRRWREAGKASDFETARAFYTELVSKFPNSPLREHNNLILGFAQMERGDAIGTLQTFQGYMSSYPRSGEVPQVRKALAEAFMILRKYDEAANEYNTIIKDFPKSEHAREAKYRLGDVQFAKGDFTQAIRSYEAAIKELPNQEKVYRNANFNMAEARFWQKDYKNALNNYVQFVNLFPRDDYGGYALTRIGELLGVLGADQRRVMGAFLESYFRFPNHPGAKVARIRMLSQQMRGMKENELKKALIEIEETGKKLSLEGIEEFTTLMVAEGLSHRGEYVSALRNLIAYYQKNPGNQEIFKSRIMRNISNELKDEVENGQFMDALAFYSKYSENWLKNSDRIDIPFFVGGAYENAGAFSEAKNIYQRALESRKRIAGTPEERERKVQEHLPSISTLNLRLASTNNQERNYIDAFQYLKAIGAGSDLSPAETVERVQLSALIAEQRNDHVLAREALTDLARKWQGDPALVAPVNLQLAQNYMKLGDPQKAELHAEKVLQALGKGEAVISERVIASAMNVKGDALFAQKKELAAVEAYQTMLERFETKQPLANVRYRVGQILFDRGDFKGASEVWQKLEGTANEFLWKVGKEKLADAKWQSEYTRYTNRIPAMVSSEKETPK
jgi:tetratricopeptide (TPR) repeat protein